MTTLEAAIDAVKQDSPEWHYITGYQAGTIHRRLPTADTDRLHALFTDSARPMTPTSQGWSDAVAGRLPNPPVLTDAEYASILRAVSPLRFMFSMGKSMHLPAD